MTYPLGRIAFINVAPVYYALEHNIVSHPFSLVRGTPAELNTSMRLGELAISSCSSVEFARRWRNYLVVDDLSISSPGPVQSVLLLSKKPADALSDKTILVSGQSHTSVILTKLLFATYFRINVSYQTGSVLERIEQHPGNIPDAVLTIGDEALFLQHMQVYPYCTDLASVWQEWTGLPFVFALWILQKDKAKDSIGYDLGSAIRKSRDWGLEHLDTVIDEVLPNTLLTREELHVYYTHALSYRLGEKELLGLTTFYQKACTLNLLPELPEFRIQS